MATRADQKTNSWSVGQTLTFPIEEIDANNSIEEVQVMPFQLGNSTHCHLPHEKTTGSRVLTKLQQYWEYNWNLTAQIKQTNFA